MTTSEEQATAEWRVVAETQPVDSFVYTYRDAAGKALYVGCTKNLTNRERQHRKQSPWFPLAASRTEAGPYPRQMALYFEARTIQDEAPSHNSYRTSGYNGPGSPKWWERVVEIERERMKSDPEYRRAAMQSVSDAISRWVSGETPAPAKPAPERPALVELRRRRYARTL